MQQPEEPSWPYYAVWLVGWLMCSLVDWLVSEFVIISFSIFFLIYKHFLNVVEVLEKWIITVRWDWCFCALAYTCCHASIFAIFHANLWQLLIRRTMDIGDEGVLLLNLSIYLSIYPSISLFFLSFFLSFSLSIHPSIYLSKYLNIFLSFTLIIVYLKLTNWILNG